MAEKPILFNTEMIKAILEGRKTQTRRIIKPQPKESHIYKLGFVICSGNKLEVGKFAWGTNEHGGIMSKARPPYQIDDTLWVRETWCKGTARDGGSKTIYKADIEDLLQPMHAWKPSIHMPRSAARIFLKVTDVRVEQLQDITIDGIEQEGILLSFPIVKLIDSEHLKRFINIWDSTIDMKNHWMDYSWGANPWVWVIEFERVR